MGHKRLAEPAAGITESLAALTPQYRNTNPAFAEWAQGRGLILHSDAVQSDVWKLVEHLTEAGYVDHSALCFKLLTQLDVLCNQVSWMVLQLSRLQRWCDESELPADALRPQAVGDTRRALAAVPVLCARLALNRLTRHQRDWFTDISDAGAALEVLQLMLETAPLDRRHRYGSRCEAVDWATLVADFGELSETQSNPGPWISPELTGVRAPVGAPTEWQAVHQVLPGERLLVLLDSRGVDMLSESLRWWHPGDCGLLVPVLLDCDDGAVPAGVTRIVDGSDPAACLCAILEAETRLGQIATDYVEDELETPVAFPMVFVRGANWWPTTADDGRCAADLYQRSRQPQALWQAAASAMKVSSRSRRASMVTVNRPAPHWRHEPSDVLAALDQYFVDFVEVNPHLRVRLAAAPFEARKRLPAALDLLDVRQVSPLQQDGYQPSGAIVEVVDGLEMASVVLGNQMGLNLVLLDNQQALAALDPLLLSSHFARAQAMVDEPAAWAGIPLLTRSDWWLSGSQSGSRLLEFSEAMLAQNADQVRVLMVPEANTAMCCLKQCYGEFGVISQLVLDEHENPPFEARQAEQLVAHGAICLAGNCGAELQLVACGSRALNVAREVSAALKLAGTAHSLVYLLEPGRFRSARDEQEERYLADKSLTSSLFPEHVQHRLILTDLHPEVLLGHCRRLDLGPKRTAALGFLNQYPNRSEDVAMAANGLNCQTALSAIQDMLASPLL